MFLLAIALVGCGRRADDPCEAMCAAAADLYGGCLDDWGVGWTAAGYADEYDFIDACETWAWQMRRLEDRAGHNGATDAACARRTARFEAPDATCDDYTSIDWSSPPWQTP